MIRFTHVSKTYPNGVTALRDVSFQIAKGEFVFLTGHSGSGKSTILSLIFADQKPNVGEVRVSGFPVGKLTATQIPRLRRKLGVVFQDFRLLPQRTIEENVAFALEVTGAPRKGIPGKVMRVLTRVGLAGKARVYPKELSGGEQQRVAIARAWSTTRRCFSRMSRPETWTSGPPGESSSCFRKSTPGALWW